MQHSICLTQLTTLHIVTYNSTEKTCGKNEILRFRGRIIQLICVSFKQRFSIIFLHLKVAFQQQDSQRLKIPDCNIQLYYSRAHQSIKKHSDTCYFTSQNDDKVARPFLQVSESVLILEDRTNCINQIVYAQVLFVTPLRFLMRNEKKKTVAAISLQHATETLS